MDIALLHDAYQALLGAAQQVADSADTGITARDGGWSADQILAHVSIVNATTTAAVCAIAAGTNATYDNRTAHDTWALERLITRAGYPTDHRCRYSRTTTTSMMLSHQRPGQHAGAHLQTSTPQPAPHFGGQPVPVRRALELIGRGMLLDHFPMASQGDQKKIKADALERHPPRSA